MAKRRVKRKVTHRAKAVAQSTGRWFWRRRKPMLWFAAGILFCNFPVPAKWAVKLGMS